MRTIGPLIQQRSELRTQVEQLLAERAELRAQVEQLLAERAELRAQVEQQSADGGLAAEIERLRAALLVARRWIPECPVSPIAADDLQIVNEALRLVPRTSEPR